MTLQRAYIRSVQNGFLPLAEYTRQAVITGALSRGMDVIITNSDGAPARRKYLLDRLGVGAVEEIIDPGEDVVFCSAQFSKKLAS